jgi:hypothetical protein
MRLELAEDLTRPRPGPPDIGHARPASTVEPQLTRRVRTRNGTHAPCLVGPATNFSARHRNDQLPPERRHSASTIAVAQPTWLVLSTRPSRHWTPRLHSETKSPELAPGRQPMDRGIQRPQCTNVASCDSARCGLVYRRLRNPQTSAVGYGSAATPCLLCNADRSRRSLTLVFAKNFT